MVVTLEPKQSNPLLLRHLSLIAPGERMSAKWACHWKMQFWAAPVPCAGTSHTPVAPVSAKDCVYWRKLALRVAAVVLCAKRPSLAGCGTTSHVRIAVVTGAIASPAVHAMALVNGYKLTGVGCAFLPVYAMVMC
jgi:hypothetical protein